MGRRLLDGVVIGLDPILVGSGMVKSGQPARVQAALAIIDVSPFPSDLLDAVVRLVRLVDSPVDQPFLVPLTRREIDYRLLGRAGPAGAPHRQPRRR